MPRLVFMRAAHCSLLVLPTQPARLRLGLSGGQPAAEGMRGLRPAWFVGRAVVRAEPPALAALPPQAATVGLLAPPSPPAACPLLHAAFAGLLAGLVGRDSVGRKSVQAGTLREASLCLAGAPARSGCPRCRERYCRDAPGSLALPRWRSGTLRLPSLPWAGSSGAWNGARARKCQTAPTHSRALAPCVCS